MTKLGSYDADLQMFVQESREPELRHLVFLRWLGEHGLLEHAVAGPSTGILAPEGYEARPAGELVKAA